MGNLKDRSLSRADPKRNPQHVTGMNHVEKYSLALTILLLSWHSDFVFLARYTVDSKSILLSQIYEEKKTTKIYKYNS